MQVVRYLKVVSARIDELPGKAARDLSRQDRVQAVLAAVREVAQRGGVVTEARYMVEELRVSLWAPALGTAHPMSKERIFKVLDRC